MTPKLPKQQTPPGSPPSLLDPLVIFQRMRTRQKAATLTGRQSTILTTGGATVTGQSSYGSGVSTMPKVQ